MILSRFKRVFLCTFVIIHWHNKKRVAGLKNRKFLVLINKHLNIMRQRIKKSGAVLACRAAGAKAKKNLGYCPQTLILWAIVVSGLSIFQGSRKECDDLCIQLRMQNQPAEVVQVKTCGGLWR